MSCCTAINRKDINIISDLNQLFQCYYVSLLNYCSMSMLRLKFKNFIIFNLHHFFKHNSTFNRLKELVYYHLEDCHDHPQHVLRERQGHKNELAQNLLSNLCSNRHHQSNALLRRSSGLGGHLKNF